MENFEKEKTVDQYLMENNIKGAVQLLYELIVSHAEARNFEKALALREKLMTVDAMALNEIIKSGEIIEKCQEEAIDGKHLSLWSGLYGKFSTDEKNRLFFSSMEEKYGPNQVILEQNKQNPFLYLIDEGVMKMTCRLKNKELMVKKIGPGEFTGDDTFLSIQAYSSVTLTTEGDAKARKVPREQFIRWAKDFPGLHTKLTDFILKTGTTQELLNAMQLRRRNYNRIVLSGNGRFQFMDNKGKPMGGPVKGSLLDFSMGGMSFAIRITKRETARMILGRRLNAQFEVQNGEELVLVDRNGIIVSVGEYNLDDYALHMKYDLLLEEDLVKAVENQATAN